MLGLIANSIFTVTSEWSISNTSIWVGRYVFVWHHCFVREFRLLLIERWNRWRRKVDENKLELEIICICLSVFHSRWARPWTAFNWHFELHPIVVYIRWKICQIIFCHTTSVFKIIQIYYIFETINNVRAKSQRWEDNSGFWSPEESDDSITAISLAKYQPKLLQRWSPG